MTHLLFVHGDVSVDVVDTMIGHQAEDSTLPNFRLPSPDVSGENETAYCP
jgi:hypothetical protein